MKNRCLSKRYLFAAFLLFSFLSAPLLYADYWDDVAAAMQRGDHQAALDVLSKEGDAGNYQVQRIMGVCEMELGNYSQAEIHFYNRLS